MIRALEFLWEVLGWLRIFISPAGIGCFFGFAAYYNYPTALGMVLGILIAALGVTIGAIWATRTWKGEGTQQFLSHIYKSPDVGKAADENDKK